LRTQRNVIVLAVSLAAHLALLAAWFSTRQDLRWTEPPTMEIQLVRPPPRAEPERPPQPPKTPIRPHLLPAPPPELPDQPPLPAPTPRPQAAQTPLILPDGSPWIPPSSGGPRRLERSARKPPCKTTQDPSNRVGEPCAAGSLEEAIARHDAERDVANADFVAGGREKRAMKRYHELPGAAGFPGLRCTLFSRC